MNQINACCADCGEEGGVSLKVCKSCMLVKYCNAECQKNHWQKHKKDCKQHAAEIHNEALFKDPPAKEDCPICSLPMPLNLVCCMSLPPATITSVPIYEFAEANRKLSILDTETFYSCCGKTICKGCVYSSRKSGNHDKCPFCKSDRSGKTDEVVVEEIMTRAETNDADSIYVLAQHYRDGEGGLQQDRSKTMELLARASELGSSKAHFALGCINKNEGDLKKAKFHYEAAAMAGHEVARSCVGSLECNSGNMERAVKHLAIAASAGDYDAMQMLQESFNSGFVNRESIDSTLTAYNDSCAKMRSDSRDAYIRRQLRNLKICVRKNSTNAAGRLLTEGA